MSARRPKHTAGRYERQQRMRVPALSNSSHLVACRGTVRPVAEATSLHFRSRASLALLLLVSLSLRAGWGWTRDVSSAAIDALPDQREYLSLAQNLLDHGQLRFLDRRFAEQVYAYRTPGYPFFLAACGARARVARLAQAVLDTSTVLAVYLLGKRLKPEPGTAPLLAAALVAFNPFLIYFSGLLLSETLFTALLAWGMVLIISAEIRRRSSVTIVTWLAGAMLLAMSVLVRPEAILLPIALGAIAAFMNPRRRLAYQVGWAIAEAAATAILILIVLTPWAARNRHVLGKWIWLTTNGGVTLYDGFHPGADGASDQSFLHSMPQLAAMGEVRRSEYLTHLAVRYIAEHPLSAAELGIYKLARTWSPMPISAQFGSGLYRAGALAYSVPFDVLVLWGLASGRLQRAAKVFLVAPALYFTAVHTLSVGSLRYRIPSEPPMAVIAASACPAIP